MNLRILKKLSKKAVPLLKHFDCRGDVFNSARGDNSIGGIHISARKHWDRGRSVHDDCICEHEIKRPARDGKGGWIYMRPPFNPLKGTPMVGAESGYYEPEWVERTAWEELQDCVSWQGRPASMTDAEWALTLRLSRTTPVTEEEMDAWMIDDDEAVEAA